MYDIIIKNGTIIDGTGQPMFAGDVAVKEDRIVEVGRYLHGEKADVTIDADGLYVSPGFVDVNNHSDTHWRIFSSPSLESLLYQGITTVVGGGCGSSLSPLLTPESIKSIQKWVDIRGLNINWNKTDEFFKEIEKRDISVNFGTLTGHATLRRGIVGDQSRDLSKSEVDVLKKYLKESIGHGALGMSTGLAYSHAYHAPESEISTLVGLIAERGGVYTTHVRDEGREVVKSVSDAVNLAKKTGAKIHISHLKVMFDKNWDLMDSALEKIEAAFQDGVDVSFDMYPYPFTGSVLYTLLPPWVFAGGKNIMLGRLRDQKVRRVIIHEMRKSGIDYASFLILSSPFSKTLSRKRIGEIASLREKSPEETILDILTASRGRVVIITDSLSEDNIKKTLIHPLSIISSNGAGYGVDHQKTHDMVHPRSFGTVPRFFRRYVREEGLLSWEKAVYKMSGKPAKKFGIKKRGALQAGNYADIVVFDPASIEDRATIDRPYQYSRGVEWLIVNGKITIRKGNFTGIRNGKVIRKSRWEK